MPIRVEQVIDAPPDTVWTLLTDTHRWPQWGPSVRAVQCAERYIGGGSSGRVLTTLGFWAPFVITDFDEARYWSWRVFGIPATGHQVNPLGENRCRLVFEIPIVAAPYAAVCKVAMQRIAQLSQVDRA
ncbi:MAG: SRPBCC family protein [Candidatus Competibacteraceae bacterium]